MARRAATSPRAANALRNGTPRRRTARGLTLLVGTYAQAHYLPQTRKLSMTERVREGDHLPQAIPLPHWPGARRCGGQNAWFEAEVLPVLREAIARRS